MDKFVQRTTLKRAAKRGHDEDENSMNKKKAPNETTKDLLKVSKPEKESAGWHRCDSMTESAHHSKKAAEASPKKRQKLEKTWSPIRPLKTLATIDEYPDLHNCDKNEKRTRSKSRSRNPTLENQKPAPAAVIEESIEVSYNPDVSIYDLSLDFGNKSWADLVYEEEESNRIDNITQKNQMTSPEQKDIMGEKTPEKKQRKEKVKFKENATLTKAVGETLKFDRLRSNRTYHYERRSANQDENNFCKPLENPHQNIWHDRLRSPGKVQQRSSSGSGASSSTAAKSPRHKPYEPKSPRSAWRKHAILDEDSQNTMTEVTKVTRSVRGVTPHSDESQSRSAVPARALYMPPVEIRKEPPKGGWESDPAVVKRREKDLNKGYNSEAYKQYAGMVNKAERIRGVHPQTPNKHHKMPRRSWDMQVRVWRRLLYAAINADIPSDASFMSSNCSETTSENDDIHDIKLDIDDDITLMKADANENTLKASCDNVKGPTDFSVLSSDTSG